MRVIDSLTWGWILLCLPLLTEKKKKRRKKRSKQHSELEPCCSELRAETLARSNWLTEKSSPLSTKSDLRLSLSLVGLGRFFFSKIQLLTKSRLLSPLTTGFLLRCFRGRMRKVIHKMFFFPFLVVGSVFFPLLSLSIPSLLNPFRWDVVC